MHKTIYITGILVLLFLAGVATRAFAALADEQPPVVSAVAPAFPPIARAARQQGDVVVEVTIDAKGNVQTAKAVSGSVLLHKASETAAKKWKFAPGTGDSAIRSVKLTFAYGYADSRDKADPEYTVTFLPPYRVEVKWSPPPRD